jgi:hypothetical protein
VNSLAPFPTSVQVPAGARPGQKVYPMSPDGQKGTRSAVVPLPLRVVHVCLFVCVRKFNVSVCGTLS